MGLISFALVPGTNARFGALSSIGNPARAIHSLSADLSGS
jgi:hypothetical protein